MKLATNPCQSKLSNSHRCHKRKSYPARDYQTAGKFCLCHEADLLNVALFGITAKEWRDDNPDKTENIRDYATLEQLVVLSNMESVNALLIRQGLSQSERLLQLNKVAITQMKSLLASNTMKKLK